jgi:hypothetical protein
MWIHEAVPSNPLYALAKQDLQVPMSPVVQYNAGQLFGPDGKPLNLGFYAVSHSCSTVVCYGRFRNDSVSETFPG